MLTSNIIYQFFWCWINGQHAVTWSPSCQDGTQPGGLNSHSVGHGINLIKSVSAFPFMHSLTHYMLIRMFLCSLLKLHSSHMHNHHVPLTKTTRFSLRAFHWGAHAPCKVGLQWSAYLGNGCQQHSVLPYCREPHVFSTNRWVSSEPCESLCQQWWAGNEFAWDRALRWAALNQVKMPDTCMYCGFSVQNTKGGKKEGFQFMATTLIPITYDWVYLRTSIV